MVRLALRPHWFLVLLEQVRPHLVSYLLSYSLCFAVLCFITVLFDLLVADVDVTA